MTLDPATLSNTTLYAGEATLNGNYVHVSGYQNKAHNLSDGPNAMILPFPSKEAMGRGNVIDTSGTKHIITDLAKVIPRPDRTRGFSKGYDSRGLDDDFVEVFETGPYTVIMSRDARAIPGALGLVPRKKRPQVNKDIFDAYATWYPKWPIALCCFEAGQEVEPSPMLWWFEPMQPDWLFAPGLDGHDGKVPSLKRLVHVNTDIIFGTTRHSLGGASNKVHYRDLDTLSADMRQLLPQTAVGINALGMMKNGDYLLPLGKLAPNSASADFQRMPPPGA